MRRRANGRMAWRTSENISGIICEPARGLYQLISIDTSAGETARDSSPSFPESSKSLQWLALAAFDDQSNGGAKKKTGPQHPQRKHAGYTATSRDATYRHLS